MKTRNKTKIMLTIVSMIICTSFILSGCNSVSLGLKEMEEALSGLSVTIRTFDEESQVVDIIHGKSVMAERDATFDTYSDGSSNADSSVIKITIGDNTIHHVGSSLILAENSLEDIFVEYAKTVDIDNMERGVPIINEIVNSFKNITSGKAKVILIRSQNGTPLATYVGDKVSVFSSEIPKSTVFLVDGQMLLVYRCDYTVYDTELLLD